LSTCQLVALIVAASIDRRVVFLAIAIHGAGLAIENDRAVRATNNTRGIVISVTTAAYLSDRVVGSRSARLRALALRHNGAIPATRLGLRVVCPLILAAARVAGIVNGGAAEWAVADGRDERAGATFLLLLVVGFAIAPWPVALARWKNDAVAATLLAAQGVNLAIIILQHP